MEHNALCVCPLCGYQFDPSGMTCHTSCPLSSGCHILCCPSCGYQVPDETRMALTSALRRGWQALTRARRAGDRA